MGEIILKLPEMPKEPAETSLILSNSLAMINVMPSQFHELSEEEQTQVSDFAEQITLCRTICTDYGELAQGKLKELVKESFDAISKFDTDIICTLLTQIATLIKGFNTDVIDSAEDSLLRSAKKKTETLYVKYDTVSDKIKDITADLKVQEQNLSNDITKLDEICSKSSLYYKELTMYILAGRKKLDKARTKELEDLHQKAAQPGAHEAVLLYNDFSNMCEKFDKRLCDIELTRTICLQTIAQVRLVQDVNSQLIQEIRSHINNSTSVWEQAMINILISGYDRAAASTQNGVIDISGLILNNKKLLEVIEQVIEAQKENDTTRAKVKLELKATGA